MGYCDTEGIKHPCGDYLGCVEWEAREGETPPTGDSHGICEPCLEKLKVEWRKEGVEV